ncbi:hypothetical protein [Dinoroseobacter sp. S76]|uniref:hypothetical protein n=1 Tax=Dinoroseobacter sp. S76 TaxID=3415124 RepID=UPI003C7DB420
MLHRVYRQRRRILVCATAFTLTALIGTMTDGRALAHVPFWAPPVATLLFFGLCALAVAGLVAALPQLRRLCEVVALFTLFETLFIWILPEANRALSNPVLRLAIAATAIALLYLIFYGRLLERVPALFAFGARHKIQIKAPPEQVWHEIAPASVSGRDATPAEPAQSSPTLVQDVPSLWQHPPETTTVILLERPWRCRFAVKPDSAQTTRAAGIYDLRLRPTGQGVLLEIGLYQTGIPLGEVLRLWLDDVLGAEIAGLKAEMEGQSERDAPPLPPKALSPA